MKEKILITVKTYPVLSRTYTELVCTAGVNEQGEWRRIYPVRFRQLRDENKYKKYQWIEADLIRDRKDDRPESRRIENADELRTCESLSTDKKWAERRRHFIDKVTIHDDLTKLISLAHKNELSLALFRPKVWKDFKFEPVSEEWDEEKIAHLEKQRHQLDFFRDENAIAEDLKIVRKLPYKFSYAFEDINSKLGKLMIEDWEIGALYWNCLMSSNNDRDEAVRKVKQKYLIDFVRSGKYSPLLILGTTLEFHKKKAPNPFIIIGVIPLPQTSQAELAF